MNTKGFTVALLLFLILVLGGCDQFVPLIPNEPEQNDLVGVWTIHSINGEPFDTFVAGEQAQPPADYFSLWTFYLDGQFEFIWGLTPAPNEFGVQDVPQFYFRIEGTYTLEGAKYTLTLGQSIGFFDASPGEETVGTWVREGSTLTLTGDDGTVLVLKEKF